MKHNSYWLTNRKQYDNKEYVNARSPQQNTHILNHYNHYFFLECQKTLILYYCYTLDTLEILKSLIKYALTNVPEKACFETSYLSTNSRYWILNCNTKQSLAWQLEIFDKIKCQICWPLDWKRWPNMCPLEILILPLTHFGNILRILSIPSKFMIHSTIVGQNVTWMFAECTLCLIKAIWKQFF